MSSGRRMRSERDTVHTNPIDDIFSHVFGGAFGRDPFASGSPFFSDPFFGGGFAPLLPPPPRSFRLGREQGATIEEVHEGEHEHSTHKPLVEEPDDAGPRQRRRTGGAGPSASRSSPGDIVEQFFGGRGGFGGGWFDDIDQDNGAGSFAYSSRSYSSFGAADGGSYSQSTTVRRGPGGVEEREETVRDAGQESVTRTRRIGDKGRTTTLTRDGSGAQRSQELLYGLESEADAARFDAEWERHGGRAKQPSTQERRRAWLPQLPGLGRGRRDGNGGGSGASAGGSRDIPIA